MLSSKYIEKFLEKHVDKGSTITIGTSKTAYNMIKELALKNIIQDFDIKILPTSIGLAELAHDYHMKLASFDNNIDLVIEFGDSADNFYNFSKNQTNSLIRDKQIAYYAKEVIVFVEDVVNKIDKFPVEIARFGFNKTLNALDNLGKVTIRKDVNGYVKTLGQNYLVDLKLDTNYTYDDVDFRIKNIPGILETGLFCGLADKIFVVKKNKINKM